MNDASITITYSIFIQMLVKLAQSTVVTVAGMYCMKIIRDVRRKIGASGERPLAREITILLTDEQRKLVNEATSQRSTDQPLSEGGESRTIPDGPSIALELTPKQRRQVKKVTGQNPRRLRVGIVSADSEHQSIKAVFDRSGWITTLQEGSAMDVWQFVEGWASTFLFVVFLGVKMYLNVMHWIFNK